MQPIPNWPHGFGYVEDAFARDPIVSPDLENGGDDERSLMWQVDVMKDELRHLHWEIEAIENQMTATSGGQHHA